MKDLYKVDLDSFVSLDSETTYSSSPAAEKSPEEDEDYEGEEYEEESYDDSEEE